MQGTLFLPVLSPAAFSSVVPVHTSPGQQAGRAQGAWRRTTSATTSFINNSNTRGYNIIDIRNNIINIHNNMMSILAAILQMLDRKAMVMTIMSNVNQVAET